jgi:hypothetical protein
MDDPAFVAWATGWENYLVGHEVSSTFRTPEKALGPAAGTSFDIVCLGRGGEITLTFDLPIKNHDGWDFAVFENSFSDAFLELAYVEVSSDGQDFVRFDNDSLTPGPVGGFGSVDPADINGFAGKYRQGYGMPFDLQDLAEKPEVLDGTVNLARITHVKIMDIAALILFTTLTLLSKALALTLMPLESGIKTQHLRIPPPISPHCFCRKRTR